MSPPKVLQVAQIPSKYKKINSSVPAEKQEQDDPKEIILRQVRKYIKTGKPNEQKVDEPEKTEEIMKNLRDFLGYLENKGIINPTKLQS